MYQYFKFCTIVFLIIGAANAKRKSNGNITSFIPTPAGGAVSVSLGQSSNVNAVGGNALPICTNLREQPTMTAAIGNDGKHVSVVTVQRNIQQVNIFAVKSDGSLDSLKSMHVSELSKYETSGINIYGVNVVLKELLKSETGMFIVCSEHLFVSNDVQNRCKFCSFARATDCTSPLINVLLREKGVNVTESESGTPLPNCGLRYSPVHWLIAETKLGPTWATITYSVDELPPIKSVPVVHTTVSDAAACSEATSNVLEIETPIYANAFVEANITGLASGRFYMTKYDVYAKVYPLGNVFFTQPNPALPLTLPTTALGLGCHRGTHNATQADVPVNIGQILQGLVGMFNVTTDKSG